MSVVERPPSLIPEVTNWSQHAIEYRMPYDTAEYAEQLARRRKAIGQNLRELMGTYAYAYAMTSMDSLCLPAQLQEVRDRADYLVFDENVCTQEINRAFGVDEFTDLLS